MKLVAGMGSIDDYTDYVTAGADELFIGFVPESWQRRYGLNTPLNRREVCYYNVQVGSESELMLLNELVEKHRVPVTIAINGLHYRPEQYPVIAEIMMNCRHLGFSRFILADPALIVYLNRQGLSNQFHIHVSGEYGEINRYVLRDLRERSMDRLIFHRKVSLTDMASLTALDSSCEYEAFFLNEMCHFHGGYCNSLHGDDLPPVCHLPYRYFKDGQPVPCEGEVGVLCDESMVGATGCGLCALWRLRKAGITHLKIVGRGGYSDQIIRDLRIAQRALEWLYYSDTEQQYLNQLQNNLFGDGCSKHCLYRDITIC